MELSWHDARARGFQSDPGCEVFHEDTRQRAKGIIREFVEFEHYIISNDNG